ncbi:calcineurin-like phosphoesterase family protein [Candidatus Neoehrlichia lotoris str. RAC413]|uniref:Calcineurin-like phosphoesterase family protein n=2 Tax=Candidatus Neoehrlichia procyonis TaxID=467750 RepID=A0A0F3NRQ8_9RICK|nr:calcineurin-like phosphoesterase family protein [Candidatus Neoehrlichia lotoris str. RAC413]
MVYFFSICVKADVLFIWSQVVSGNNLSVRAIVSLQDDCPIISIDNQTRKMDIRAFPIYEKNAVFDNKVCEALISNTAKVVKVGDDVIPVLPSKIKKIAIIGDTGCRVSSYYQQNCKLQDTWPLEKILYQISQHNPDLVIHVGDYLYREKDCVDDKECDKGIYGDNFNTWKLDWLAPSKLLSKKAPFIFVRGNHENCNRAYKGWFRYLSASPFADISKEACKGIVDSWVFTSHRLGICDLNFYIHDSSGINEVLFSKQDINNVRSGFLDKLDDKLPTWLLTHRPLWSYADRMGIIYYGNLLQVKAFGNILPKNLLAIVSGHLHIGQTLIIRIRDGKDVITQVIVGNSGTKLDNVKFLKIHDIKIGDFAANNVQSVEGFGFAIAQLNKNYSIIKYYNVENKEVHQLKILNKIS